MLSDILKNIIGIWTRPWQTLRSVKEQPNEMPLLPYVVIVLITSIVSVVVLFAMSALLKISSLSFGETLLAAAVTSLSIIAGSFLGALAIWGISAGFLTSTWSQYKKTFALVALISAFSPVVFLVSAPVVKLSMNHPAWGFLLSLLINLWPLIVLVYGTALVMGTPTVRTCVIMTIFVIVMFILSRIIPVFLQMAASQLPGGGFPNARATGDFGNADDFMLDDENDLKALQDDLAHPETPKTTEQPKKK